MLLLLLSTGVGVRQSSFPSFFIIIVIVIVFVIVIVIVIEKITKTKKLVVGSKQKLSSSKSWFCNGEVKSEFNLTQPMPYPI